MLVSALFSMTKEGVQRWRLAFRPFTKPGSQNFCQKLNKNTSKM